MYLTGKCEGCSCTHVNGNVTENSVTSDDVSELISDATNRLSACGICMVEYKSKMKAFPCDHAICEDCVSKLTRWCTSCDRAHCIKCPMCNDMVYCVTQLSDDHRNDKFLDVIKAVSSRGIGKTRQLIYSFKRSSAIDLVDSLGLDKDIFLMGICSFQYS